MTDPSFRDTPRRRKLWATQLALWLELEDGRHSYALLAMPGVHSCARLCRAVADERAETPKTFAVAGCHGLKDLSRREGLPGVQQAGR